MKCLVCWLVLFQANRQDFKCITTCTPKDQPSEIQSHELYPLLFHFIPGNGVASSPYTSGVVAIEKEAFVSPSTKVFNLFHFIVEISYE